jgi:hypothetical protein
MRVPRKLARAAAVLAAAAAVVTSGAAATTGWAATGQPAPGLAATGQAAGQAAAGRTASGTGWVRLAHLSPNAPAVDVYLYSFGNSRARLVLHHVSYGMVSPYEQVPPGDYTVSMRAAGAPPTAKALLSTGFGVSAGASYTVAGMGPASGLRLQVLKGTLSVPPGRALVRVIQASLRQHVVRVSLGGQVLARRLSFASTTGYQPVATGTTLVRVAGSTERASLGISLRPGTVHTLVVLDGAGRLRVTDLTDAAGSQVEPSGGAATGLGGTAPRPAPSPVPWLAMILGGAMVATAGALGFCRARPPAGPRRA